MLRDVFYYGKKPNVHPREKFASSLSDARQQSTTDHFWIINEYCDYRGFDWDFDFEFLPDEDVWAEEHNNVWPSQHQKDSGTWLCPKENSDLIVYRADVDPIKRKNIKTDNWVLLDKIDESKFDFSWHPDPTDPPYIYKWGCKFYPAQIKHVLEYHVEDATDVKYMRETVELLPEDYWVEYYPIDKEHFDFTWRPDPMDPPFIYVWGNKHVDGKVAPTLEYHTPGATDRKHLHDLIPLIPHPEKFEHFDNCSGIDYTWVPNPTSPPYIYAWGNQWNKPEDKISIQYVVEGATEYKYMDERATRKPSMDNWVVPNNIDVSKFDFSWEPSPKEPPFIYQFGTQWQKTGGPQYIVEGATDVKYIEGSKAKMLPNMDYWETPDKVKIAEFDYSWHPDATEKPYIYQFGTQWVLTGGPRYAPPGATEIKFVDVDVHHAIAGPDFDKWIVPEDIDKESFDFSWHPHPDDPPFVYQFATQWQKTDGPRYIAEDAEDGFSAVKYIDARILKAKRLPSQKNWKIPEGVDVSKFDFSWHPDATAPKYIYQFGTLVDDKDGPRYEPEDNNGEVVYLERTEIKLEEVNFPQYYIKTTLEDLIKEHKNEIFWALRENIDYTSFDFHWIPNKENVYHINVFGSPESEITQTYFVNGKMIERGYMQMNYVDSAKIDEEYLFNLFKKVDMFFVDRGNPESQSRFEVLKQKYPKIQKTRYLNTWVDTINRCINRSTGELCWILNSELDYNGFDFNYYPTPWQMKMIHVFGTQWSHWGTTFLINRETFPNDTKYVKIIEHLPNLNFVKNRTARATNVLYDTVYIDHGNRPAPNDVTVVEYDESYLKTFKKMLEKLPTKKEHYVWVVSSICDYSHFDFTYICDPFAKDQLHVFPSDRQKFGDTFLVDVNKLRELIVDMTVLEQYTKINYNQHQRVKRLPAPTIITESDTHVSAIHTDFNWPYATFQTSDNQEINIVDTEPMSLWAPETKNIQITSVGGTRIVVPKEAKNYVKRELYDYPYIQTNKTLAKSKPMDIVFLSNGEEGADKNYEHLLKTVEGLPNRVVRVDGVNGRVAAYHAAAEASNTPWLFTVFAKLKVSAKFDWNWQPDRLQVPKHYVFHAKNPVNGLVYGHQAMIAYNKKLTLANQGKGLDFTMDDEHEVLEINSGIAMFNTDEWSTWRTAFREALKLRAENSEISKNRLEFWLTVGMGNYAEYSMEGAQHAVEYYEEVNGDFDKLKLSYEWTWLRKFYESKYKT